MENWEQLTLECASLCSLL